MRLQDCKFLVVDTETTGLNPAEDRVVSLASVSVHFADAKYQVNRIEQDSFVNPGRPIPPEA